MHIETPRCVVEEGGGLSADPPPLAPHRLRLPLNVTVPEIGVFFGGKIQREQSFMIRRQPDPARP